MPVKVNGYSNAGRNAARELRRLEANIRATYWQSLTPEEQIAELDRRPGYSDRQRARIIRKQFTNQTA